MAKTRKRTVQTCSLCEKTGHNKRRCSFAIKQEGQKTETARKKHVPQRMVPRVIKTDSRVGTPKKTKKKHGPQKHYVPVVMGKKPAYSEHIVDLSQEKSQGDISVGSIFAFREQLADTTDRKTVDFAASIRVSKKRQTRQTKKRTSRFAFQMPRIVVPKIVFPRMYISLPTISFPKVPAPFIRMPNINVRAFAPAVVGLVLLIALPIPVVNAYQTMRGQSAYIVSASTDAFVSLQESTTAAFQADTATAQFALQDALAAFADVEMLLEHDYKIVADILGALPFVGDHVSGRRAIVNAGQHIALGNTYVIKGISDAQEAGSIPMTERLAILATHMEQALPQYEEARRALVSVDSRILPDEKQMLFEQFLVLYSTFIDDIQDLVDLSHVLYDVFGGDAFRRYLVLFQNHHEIRPTGGFIGSFAMIDTQKGRIDNITIPGGGSYDLQGQLDKHIVPPLPLQLVNDKWEFQDINWFFDFPTTARKAESFVASARGTTVDGTIAVNASVIERLLRVIGPVTSSKYDVLLDAETILPTLQHHVEDGYTAHEDEAPKEILSNVLDSLLAAMQTIEPDQLMVLLRELHEALGQKEIQVALKHASVHEQIASFGWTGEVIESDARQDYVSVVATNLHGQKSDARMIQDIEHTAEVQADGSVVVQVGISRTHTGVPGQALYGATNISYMRLYVPEGAVLLNAGGFIYPPEEAFKVPEAWYTEDADLKYIEKEIGTHKNTGTRITNEFGKTVFGNWMIVQPGESQEIWFSYRLPFSVVDKKRDTGSFVHMLAAQPDAVSRYSLVAQKQSGVDSTFSSTIQYPRGWNLRWRSHDVIDWQDQHTVFRTTLKTDVAYGVVLEQYDQ